MLTFRFIIFHHVTNFIYESFFPGASSVAIGYLPVPNGLIFFTEAVTGL